MTPWIISGLTVITVYFLDRWENKYLKSIFDWVPSILLAYLIPAAISALFSIDYSAHSIHQFSKLYFIPLAIVAVMSTLSFSQLKAIGWKPIAVFVGGSLWIAIFPVFIVWMFSDLHLVKEVLVAEEYWKGIPPIVGSWIGGSTSQLVLKEAVECPEAIFLTVLVFDNILVNIWTILMFQGIKKSDWLNKVLKINSKSIPDHIAEQNEKVIHPLLISVILLTIVLGVNAMMESFIAKIIVLSFIGLLLSNLIKAWNFKFALQAGGILIITVMAILGLKLNFSLVDFDLNFLLFLIIWLISHFVIMLLIAKLLNVNAAWVPIASMANVGGIATAPAVTAAYEPKWMPHAIILAILSMATGTFWGLVTIYLLNFLIT